MQSHESRDLHEPGVGPVCDLVLRGPPNWTAVIFLAGLAFLHLSIAVPAFLSGRWEGYLSLIFGVVFTGLSLLSTRCRFELCLLAAQRRVRLRYGFGRLSIERSVPFTAIHGVRLTLSANPKRPTDSKIELLCPYEDIECPPTRIPRQEALFLAMILKAPLIKVSEDSAAEPAPESWHVSPPHPELTRDREV